MRWRFEIDNQRCHDEKAVVEFKLAVLDRKHWRSLIAICRLYTMTSKMMLAITQYMNDKLIATIEHVVDHFLVANWLNR